MRQSTALFFVGFLLLACAVIVAQAQIEDCPALAEEVLSQVDDWCSPMERGAACYGTHTVESTTFVVPRPADFFLAPGDQAALADLREIHPQPWDDAAQSFGVALLNVEANVPNSIPGQSVIFLLMGDARLTNEVPPGSRQSSPFQSFYFLPGVGQANCYEAEPMLTIQTPGSITITITLNGVETEMAPGTLLTITSKVCTIHRGSIIQRVGDKTDALFANQTVDIFIDEAGRVNVTNLRAISEREYQRGQQVQAALNAVAQANGWLEQFVVEPRAFDPEPGESVGPAPTEAVEVPPPAATPEAAASGAPAPGACPVQHTVVRGETLHRIAQRYDTSVVSIIEANQLANPRVIFPGQALCIPNPGSGFEGLPPGY